MMKIHTKIQQESGIDTSDLSTALMLLTRGTGSTSIKLFINGEYRDVTGLLLVSKHPGAQPEVVIHAETDPDKMPDKTFGVKLARNLREDKRLRLYGREVAAVPAPANVTLDITQLDHTATEQEEPA